MKEGHKIYEEAEFRVGSLGEKERIARFLDQIFGDKPNRKRYVEWLYSENPDCLEGGVNSIVAVRFDGGDIVGHSGLILDTLCNKNESVLLAWGADYGVDPSFRGKGYAKRLLVETLKNVDCYVNVCMAKSTIAVMTKLGGVKLGEAHTMIMPLTWSRYSAYVALKNRLKSFRRDEWAVMHRLMITLRRLNMEWLPSYTYLIGWKLKESMAKRGSTKKDDIVAKKEPFSRTLYEHAKKEVKSSSKNLIWNWEKLVWAVRFCVEEAYFITISKSGELAALLCCRGPVGHGERVSVILYKIIIDDAVFRTSTVAWRELVRIGGGDAIVDVQFKADGNSYFAENEWIVGRRRPVIANCNFALSDEKGEILKQKLINMSMIDDEFHRIPIKVM